MTAHARITDQPWADGIAIYLIEQLPTVRVLLRPGHPDDTIAIEPGTDPGPSLRLPDDMGRALLDALTTHYRPDATADATALRLDLNAERGRVDRLIGALIDTLNTNRPE